MNILLITTYFPPHNNVATNRMLGFAKYLSDEHTVTVLTCKQKNSVHEEKFPFKVKYIENKTILNILNHKTDDNNFFRIFKILATVILNKIGITFYYSWKKKAEKEAFLLQQKFTFDIVITSYAPLEPHKIAFSLLKKHKNIKWIADMRDEMSTNPYIKMPSSLTLRKWEKKINKTASAVTSVSAPILDDFKKLLPDVKFFEEIRNGYDHDFRQTKPPKNDTFSLGYFGSFYGKIKPNDFFMVMEKIATKHNIKFKLYIASAYKNFTIPLSLKNAVELIPYCSYKDAILKMHSMDANLLILPTDKRKGVYSGKIFDYISSHRSILAIVNTKDVAATLIEDLNCGYIAEFGNLKSIENTFLTMYHDWMNEKIKTCPPEKVKNFHRKEEIKKLLHLITKISKKNHD